MIKLLNNFLMTSLILTVFGCAVAKTEYRETKYDLCIKKCDLTYSRYESTKLSQCRNDCSKEKYKQ